ncbi:hypothetical protein TeGR_g13688 [Tetraparma gracilis]|uniref:Uncharacterized protein n=1 Tax=Tetraparma gracilis TaxID=2962635 RepID=A0ABQ6MRW6_9STRA|nr:hypothetical protein TeGR_g13688 [Tetraparma gracilis]
MSAVAPDPPSLEEARVAWTTALTDDAILRDEFERGTTKPQFYKLAERKQIEEGLRMEAEVNESSDLKQIKTRTPLLNNAVAMTSKDGQHNIVQSSATIRAPLMDLLASMFCVGQEVNKIQAGETKTNIEVLESENEHCVIFQYTLQLPNPLSHRVWVLRGIYEKLEDGDWITSITSTEHAGATTEKDCVRATGIRLLRFSQVTPTVTRFTATATFDLNGSIPRFISDSLTTPAAARAPLATLGYFVQIKETAEFDAAGQDARALGQLLVHEMEPVRTKTRPEELEFKLHIFFYRATVLRELADVHPWFELLLLQVLRNQTSLVKQTKETKAPIASGNSGIGRAVSRAKTKMKGVASSLSSGGAKTNVLADFTERDAAITGRAMKMLMLSNATPDAAVDEWILTFPALQELETEHPFFRPFMDAIVKHLLSITDFGLKMRLFSGAALSMFDLMSDVYMIVVYLGSEETRGVAHANIVCVALSLLLQLWLVLIVNRKRSWRRIAREVLYVVTFCKPGIDAARVAAGNENDDGLAAMDPLTELAVSKAAEITCESIPAAIIQTRAFLISEKKSNIALASICISCCTTGFAAATMWDAACSSF